MTETIKCLIVDDEPLAIKLIKTHIDQLPDFEIVASCQNAIEAFEGRFREFTWRAPSDPACAPAPSRWSATALHTALSIPSFLALCLFCMLFSTIKGFSWRQ